MCDIYVGSKQIVIKDEVENISFPVLILYPTDQVSSEVSFGPYKMDVSQNADILNGQFPLVVISHGNSGSHLPYRTISTYLAKNGYIVALIEHYGNNSNNNDLGKSNKNLRFRPRHVSLTIDALIHDHHFSNHILKESIAVIGHSFGGYTALALSGGQPWTQSGQRVEVHHDRRVKAIVLMAPAAGYFMPAGSLDKVDIPILLLIGEMDHITPTKWTKDVILKGVPDKAQVTVRTILNAGHFSFLSPFPAEMSGKDFAPSTDPEGFDREEFHQKLPVEIHDFLNRHLKV